VKKDQIGIVMAVSAATLLSSGCGKDDAGSNGGGTSGETAAGAGAGGSAGSRAGGGGRAGNAGSATGGGGTGGSSIGGGTPGGSSTGGSTTAGGRAGGSANGGAASGASGRAGGGTGGDGMEGGAAGEAGGPQVTCANPVFTTSDTNGGWSDGGYYVHNNIWNADEAGPETLYACSYKNWYVTSTQPDTTSVKAYPNVHLDIDNLDGLPISNYAAITSTFAATAPDVGIYNVAYDLWLDGVGWGNGTTEIMIWTENRGQVPLGNTVPPQMTFGGEQYDVYRYTSSSDGGVQVITLLATEAQTSGSLDLKEILNWIVDEAWISADATINQIGYGVEICSTEDQPATFYFTDFSVTMN
jgi:hypothetical protein